MILKLNKHRSAFCLSCLSRALPVIPSFYVASGSRYVVMLSILSVVGCFVRAIGGCQTPCLVISACAVGETALASTPLLLPHDRRIGKIRMPVARYTIRILGAAAGIIDPRHRPRRRPRCRPGCASSPPPSGSPRMRKSCMHLLGIRGSSGVRGSSSVIERNSR